MYTSTSTVHMCIHVDNLYLSHTRTHYPHLTAHRIGCQNRGSSVDSNRLLHHLLVIYCITLRSAACLNAFQYFVRRKWDTIIVTQVTSRNCPYFLGGGEGGRGAHALTCTSMFRPVISAFHPIITTSAVCDCTFYLRPYHHSRGGFRALPAGYCPSRGRATRGSGLPACGPRCPPPNPFPHSPILLLFLAIFSCPQ